MNHEEFYKNMADTLYGSRMKQNPPSIDEAFLLKQEKVLQTPNGQKMAQELMRVRIGALDSLLIGLPAFQDAFSKYKAGIENEYGEQNKSEEEKRKEAEISALRAEIERLRAGGK